MRQQLRVSLMFLEHFDVFCDQLASRCRWQRGIYLFCRINKLKNVNYVIYASGLQLVSLRSKLFCGVQGQRITAWKKKGEGEGKEGNACRQTPGFWKPPTLPFMPDWFHTVIKHSSRVWNLTVFFCLIRIIQGYPGCQRFFCIVVTKLRSWAAKPLIKVWILCKHFYCK